METLIEVTRSVHVALQVCQHGMVDNHVENPHALGSTS